MAALFTAFDRPNYQKLIPDHVVDMLTISKEVLSHLKNGGFRVSILGRPCHSIGVDEAHEVCVNRECKEYITRPSADYINRTAMFIPVRAKALKNIERQVMPQKCESKIKPITSLTTSGACKKMEMNIRSQVDKLIISCINNIHSTNKGLQHLFNNKILTSDQVHDLMNFRQIGQAGFEHRVNYFILCTPSVKVPKKQKRLLTFTERKSRWKKVSDIEKERKLQIECWKKRVLYATSAGTNIQNAYKQCIALPRVIATSDGQPMKGNKSNTTKVLEKRYENASPQIISTSLSTGWIPDTTVIEGMFLINIHPWSAHSNIGEYADFLLRQHILPYFRTVSREVHLLFDDPDCQVQSPKYFERKRRDQINPVPDDHYCTEFATDMVIPPKWRENILNCIKCKRRLICFLSQHFLNVIIRKLNPHQRFVAAGRLADTLRNKALYVEGNDSAKCNNRLTCNAEESDARIWLHVIHSQG